MRKRMMRRRSQPRSTTARPPQVGHRTMPRTRTFHWMSFWQCGQVPRALPGGGGPRMVVRRQCGRGQVTAPAATPWTSSALHMQRVYCFPGGGGPRGYAERKGGPRAGWGEGSQPGPQIPHRSPGVQPPARTVFSPHCGHVPTEELTTANGWWQTAQLIWTAPWAGAGTKAIAGCDTTAPETNGAAEDVHHTAFSTLGGACTHQARWPRPAAASCPTSW